MCVVLYSYKFFTKLIVIMCGVMLIYMSYMCRASCCQKMNFFCRSMADESAPSQHDIVRCPFLRNINEPTNFSFSLSMAFPLPARGTKGPIFEDGPNFDMAFRLFHGQNGVVSLSKGTLQFPQKVKPEQVSQQFNPLAAKAATISLSSLGGSFGFDAFNEMFKNHQKKNKKKSSQKGDSNHEATGEEWLKSGNCPIAKSYRVVSNVLPLVTKAFKLPSNFKYECPPAIVAARAALARTAFAKNRLSSLLYLFYIINNKLELWKLTYYNALAVLAQQLRLYKLPVLDTIKGFSLFRVECTETVCEQPPEKFNPNDGDGLCMIFTKSSYELSSHPV
ncbi:uncharacterized protein LOC110928666 isoform X3 [Helianthus annuus]|uniref:uncharacterized protein LOC110928666 isoform X3 n=1 Tax=Helianthus annuus TaxID=4232 RepID=UPI001652BEEF|nr:uncharacterized protein LOC110928666 isoform X3 [Helianthus annuus]